MPTNPYPSGYGIWKQPATAISPTSQVDLQDALDDLGVSGGGSADPLEFTLRRSAVISCQASSGDALFYFGDKGIVLGSAFNSFENASSSQSIASSYRSGSNNTPAGWTGNNVNNWRFGSNLHFAATCYISRTSNVIFLCGVFDANDGGFGGTDPDSSHKKYYFRYDTTQSDSHFQCICGDGSSQSVADSGVAPTAGKSQTFAIIVDDDASEAKFYIDGDLVATVSSHVPSSGAAGYQCSVAADSSASSLLIGMTQVKIQADI
jgi:hypothetical protein